MPSAVPATPSAHQHCCFLAGDGWLLCLSFAVLLLILAKLWTSFLGICIIIGCHHGIHLITDDVVGYSNHSQCPPTFLIFCRWWLIVVFEFSSVTFNFGRVMNKFCGDLPCSCMPSWHLLNCRWRRWLFQPLPAPTNIVVSLLVVVDCCVWVCSAIFHFARVQAKFWVFLCCCHVLSWLPFFLAIFWFLFLLHSVY